VLAAQRASGLSALAFSRREGLGRERLYWWRKRLERTGSRATTFVEVKARATELVEVVLGSGRVLRVPSAIEPEVLRRLVEALDEQSAC
jgi:hypothetical protein